jgi:nicotinate-nucleotide adenylyltransferase
MAPSAQGRRIGLFGGSFDPVHDAHVALAEAALAELRLDQVRWIPAGQPWQKDRAITAAAHREAMVRLAIQHEPRFVLDRIELDRAGASYTLDTVQTLAAALPGTQWFLLIGQDQYVALHTWRNWQTLLGLVVLAVANRPGPARQPHPDVLQFPHRMVPLPMLDISSTDIRQRTANGRDISELVPLEVARYIETHALYRATPRS